MQKSLSPLFALCYAKRVSKETAKSLVVLCIVLFSTPIETYMSYALNRIFDTAIGVIAALLVNYFLRRDGCGADQVVRRIAAQLDDDALSARADYVVVNIFEEDLEPAVVKLDRIFSHGSK